MQHSNLLTESKLRPPLLKQQTIRRSALIAQLDQVMTRKLGIVHAPAGYGKTTILEQFYNYRADSGVAVSWLTLDEEDQSPGRLLKHIISALERSGLPPIELGRYHERHLTHATRKSIIEELMNSLSRVTGDRILFLDDYEKADSSGTGQIVTDLLLMLPVNLHIVIATRQQPKLPLGTLKLDDELVLVDVDQMRFSESEIESFLGGMKEVALTAEDITTLTTKTEGWPITLNLIKVWQQKGGINADRVRQLSGETIEIADYLFEQVFDRLSDAEKEFALATSVLDRLNGDIANALCQRTDCWKIIEQFEVKGLFIVPLDDRRSWYRYHSLFREFLSQRLSWNDSGRVSKYHIAAGRWLARHDAAAEAIRHFLTANEPELAAETAAEKGGWQLIWSGQSALLSKVCESVPEKIIQQHVRLHLGQIYMTARTGDAQKAVTDMEELKQERKNELSSNATLAAEVQTVEVVLAGYADRCLTQQEIDDLERAANDGVLLDVALLAMIHNYLLLSYMDTCRFDRARIEADKAIAYYRASKHDFAVDLVRVHVAQSLVAEGRLSDAAVLCDMQLENDSRLFNETQAVFRVIAAEIACERNNLERASSLLDDVVSFLEEYGSWFNIYASMYRTATTLARINEGTTAALQMLERARATAAQRRILRLERFAELMSVRELALAGRTDEAGEILAGLDKSLLLEDDTGKTDLSWHIYEAPAAIQIRVSPDVKVCENHLNALDVTINKAQQHGCARQLISALNLRALIAAKLEHAEEAVRTLEKALTLATQESYQRVFIDEGRPLQELLESTLKNNDLFRERHERFARTILAGFNHPADSGKRTGTAARLTGREVDVLALIESGLSSKEIANSLELSENTVKHHRKNIYRKLGVTSRSRAIAEARHLQLFSTEVTGHPG